MGSIGHPGGLKEKFQDRPKRAGADGRPMEHIDGGTRTSVGRSPNAHSVVPGHANNVI